LRQIGACLRDTHGLVVAWACTIGAQDVDHGMLGAIAIFPQLAEAYVHIGVLAIGHGLFPPKELAQKIIDFRCNPIQSGNPQKQGVCTKKHEYWKHHKTTYNDYKRL
jgi:hypothetical protein